MEPNKIEKHIKNTLKEREISPSLSAWDNISKCLEPQKEPKKNRVFWYAVAASFIGLIVASLLVFQSQGNGVVSDVQLVDTKKEDSIDVQKDNLPETEARTVKIIDDKNTIAFENGSKTNGLDDKKVEPSKKAQTSDESLAISEQNRTRQIRLVEAVVQSSDDVIELKIAEVMAEVDLLKQKNTVVTDAEVDSLLRAAQKELLTEKIFNRDSSVDAMALLTEVEDELDQSFRDQIFEKLKSGFLKVRTAVADRNN